jgi:hypothetical protein
MQQTEFFFLCRFFFFQQRRVFFDKSFNHFFVSRQKFPIKYKTKKSQQNCATKIFRKKFAATVS